MRSFWGGGGHGPLKSPNVRIQHLNHRRGPLLPGWIGLGVHYVLPVVAMFTSLREKAWQVQLRSAALRWLIHTLAGLSPRRANEMKNPAGAGLCASIVAAARLR